MILRHLRLESFKNLARSEGRFDEGIHVVAGVNGCGKTNFLEGIAIAASGTSPRQGWKGEEIQWGQAQARIGARFEHDDHRFIRVDVCINKEKGRKVVVDGIAQKRLSVLVLSTPLVHCFSEDVDLVHRAPDLRRRFMNFLCMRLERRYLDEYRRFTRLLRQRNHLLRSRTEGALEAVYEEEFLRSAAAITKIRRRAMARLSEELASLVAPELEVDIGYRGCVAAEDAALEEAIGAALRARKDDEQRRQFTLVGPHRDDFKLRVRGNRVKGFASRGELKMAVLLLKLAEGRVVEKSCGERPLLLLDDILSEVDEGRQSWAFECLAGRGQVFLSTCTVSQSMKRHGTEIWHLDTEPKDLRRARGGA